MRILLVNAIDTSVEVETRYPNLGLAYLASSLRLALGSENVLVRIVDRRVEASIRDFRPDVVGITAVTQNFARAQHYAKQAMSKGLPVMVGGTHISALPQSLPREMHAGCIGEGERAIVDLVKALDGRGRFDQDVLGTVRGIVYHRQGTPFRTEPREQILDLDELPLPARDLVPIRPHSYMFTSRGCPYRCAFCASSRFWDRVRYFSPEYVVREIKCLVHTHRVRLVSFFDDLFVGNRSRLAQIVDMCDAEGLVGRVGFTCSARANLITEEVAGLLKRLGVSSVGMGLESGSEKTLRYLKCGSVSVDDNRRAVRILRGAGIAANASFVIGAPHESVDDIMETYRFIRTNPMSLFDTYVLTPLPGTPVWEYALGKGLVSTDMDWSRLNVNFYRNADQAILVSETIDRRGLRRLYRRFWLLRLWRNARNVWRTPQMLDLLGTLLRSTWERFMLVTSRLKEQRR